MPMIGYLSYTSAEYEAAALLPAFRQGLREIGYVEEQKTSGSIEARGFCSSPLPQLGDVSCDAPGLIAVDQSGISDSALVGALGAGAGCAGRIEWHTPRL
jgi:hypothetical protein